MPPSRHDTPISAGDCKPWLILPRRFQFRMLGALCYRFRVSAFYTPQFNLAEYAGPDICQYCRRPISGTYYRVRATMACPECTNKIRAAMAQNDSSPYPFALVCGIGAAIVGMILYSAFTILTGWIVSYVPSLLVGWWAQRSRKALAAPADGATRSLRHYSPTLPFPCPLYPPGSTTRGNTSERCSERRRWAEVSDQKGRSRQSSTRTENKTWPPGNASSRTSLANPIPTVFPPVRTHPRRLPILRTSRRNRALPAELQRRHRVRRPKSYKRRLCRPTVSSSIPLPSRSSCYGSPSDRRLRCFGFRGSLWV